MVVWTERGPNRNLRRYPTTWDMDGKGTPLKDGDIVDVIDSAYLPNIEFENPFEKDGHLVYVYSDSAISRSLQDSILRENDYFEYKYSGWTPPPNIDYIGEPRKVDSIDAGERLAHDLGWEWWFVQDGYLYQQDDADRYFVGAGTSPTTRRWNRALNWSASSGGAGGASVPGSADTAYFDAQSGNCTVDIATVTISGLGSSGFTNTLDTDGALFQVTTTAINWQAGTLRNGGVFQFYSDFTMLGTWTDVGGSIRVSTTPICTWNATLTTTYFRFGVAGATINFTGGNTITVLSEFNVGGTAASHCVLSSGSNYTFNFDAGITMKSCIYADLDHMQLGAGDTLTAFSSTDNGNNDADITFATTTYVSQASGDWNTDATWASAGGTHPGTGNTWTILTTHTVSVKGNCACGQGFVAGTLSFNGQTDSVVALLAADTDAAIQVVTGGVVSTTGVGTTGYAKLTGAELKTIGTGDIQFGAQWHMSGVCLCSRFTLDNAEKITLDGNCDNDLGFTLSSGSTFVDGGYTWTITTGTATFNGTYTATGTIQCLGDHIMSGTGMTFYTVQCGSSPGSITYTNNVTIANTMTIASGDDVILDCSSNSVTMTFSKVTAQPTLTISDTDGLKAVNTTRGYYACILGNTSYDVAVQTGTIDFDYDGTTYWRLGYCDLQVLYTTGGGGANIFCTYSITVDYFYVSNGDTLDGTAGQSITHSDLLRASSKLYYKVAGTEYFPLTVADMYDYNYHCMGRYLLDENPVIEGDFAPGDTVTVTLYDKNTRAEVDLTTSTCNEISSTGHFVWDHTNISSRATTFTQYLYVMSNSYYEVRGEYDMGGYPDTIIDDLIGTSGTTHSVNDVYTLDRNRFNDLEALCKSLEALLIKTRNAITRESGVKSAVKDLTSDLKTKKVI